MASIKIIGVNGIRPSRQPRNLPDNGAQVAHNINPATDEFTPLKMDTEVAIITPSSPVSLYRMARKADGSFNDDLSTGWITSATKRSYARGQVDDDVTERTYYTFDDGSAAPRFTTAAGDDRLLGVPAPTAAPTVVATVVDEFTVEDRTTAVQEAGSAALAAFTSNLTEVQSGPVHTGGLTGYIESSTNANETIRYFQLASENGAVTNAFVGGDVANFQWVKDSSLGGYKQLIDTVWYWGIPFRSKVRTFTVNGAALRTALEAIKVPGNTSASLMTSVQADAIADIVEAELSLTSGAKALYQDFTGKVSQLKAILENQAVLSTPAEMTAFYARAEVSSAINSAISVCANGLYASLQAIASGANQYYISSNQALSGTSFTGLPTIATVTAQINANIGLDSLNRKQVDDGALRTWMIGQISAIKTQTAIAAERYYIELVGESSTAGWRTFIQDLASSVNYQRWVASTGWPLDTATSAPSSASDLIGQIEASASAVEAYFTDKTSTEHLVQLISEYANEHEILSTVPAVVTRFVDSRFYIATYVTDLGEESARSPISSMVEMDQNDTANITIPAPPAGRNVSKWRLYRSIAGSNDAQFQFVAETAIATLTYTDSKKDSELNEICKTLDWAEPPTGLRGLTGMANGIHAGYVDSFVYFCVPYKHYAYPLKYRVTTDSPIVGLRAYGTTLVVFKRNGIDYISGTDSANMSQQRNVSLQSCVSEQSITDVDGGVVFASPDGLCLASSNGVEVITSKHFLLEGWRALVPSTMITAFHDGILYFQHGSGASAVCYAMHMVSGMLVTIDIKASAFFVDRLTDTLYYASGTKIYSAFSGATRRTGKWRSKIFTHRHIESYAWLAIESGFESAITAKIYGDSNALVDTLSVTTIDPVRIAISANAEWQVEIETAALMSSFVMSTSTEEL